MPRPASGRVPRCPTIAESASRNSGSATSAANAGTASARICRSWDRSAGWRGTSVILRAGTDRRRTGSPGGHLRVDSPSTRPQGPDLRRHRPGRRKSQVDGVARTELSTVVHSLARTPSPACGQPLCTTRRPAFGPSTRGTYGARRTSTRPPVGRACHRSRRTHVRVSVPAVPVTAGSAEGGGDRGVDDRGRAVRPGHVRLAAAERGLRPHPAAGRRGRAVRARRHDAVQGRHRRRRRGDPRHRLLPPGARAGLRGDPRPVRPRRAGRRRHRRRRAHQARRARPGRRRRLPAHAHLLGAHRGQRRLLRARSSASGRSCAAWSRPAPRSSSSATPRAAATSTTWSNQAQAEIYSVTERRTSEDYLPLVGDHGGHARRDRGLRRPRRRRWSASPPGFADLDSSPTACTRAR